MSPFTEKGHLITERLWRSVKYEEVYLNNYENPGQARQELTAYFQVYNFRARPPVITQRSNY